jgi:hypothetical protein
VTGWPFLIARGRRRGYSVLLAPDFLAGYGFLEEVAGRVPPGTPFHVATADHGGRSLCLVWTERVVTSADIGDGGPARDEHSRPLVLTVGFLCVGTISHPSEVDLEVAGEAALATYRRFLSGEEGFTTERSAPFPLSGTVLAQPPEVVRRPRRLVPVAVAGSVIAAAVVTTVALSAPGAPEPSRCPVPTTTVAPARTTPARTPTITPTPTPTPVPVPTTTPVPAGAVPTSRC